jgi:GNAT superfamily N-acetyltransferase
MLFRVYKGVLVKADLRGMPPIADAEKRIRWASVEDIDAIAELRGNPAEIRRWFEHGYDIAVAERDRRIVGFECYQRSHQNRENWSLPNRKEPWLRLQVNTGHIWCIAAHVYPRHRGQNIVADLIFFAAEHYVKLGYSYAFGVIDADNVTATRAHAKRGFHPIGQLFLIRALWFAFLRLGHCLKIGWWSAKRPLAVPVEEWLRAQ